MAVKSVTGGLKELNKYTSKPGLTVVDCFAEWCEPCRFIAPFVAKTAAETPGVTFLKVDVDAAEDVVEKYDVATMPTFLFFKSGKEVDKLEGADRRTFRSMVERHGGGGMNKKRGRRDDDTSSDEDSSDDDDEEDSDDEEYEEEGEEFEESSDDEQQ